ncbi:hypothetical protein NKG05_28310 [Oerskovia sp. M15]
MSAFLAPRSSTGAGRSSNEVGTGPTVSGTVLLAVLVGATILFATLAASGSCPRCSAASRSASSSRLSSPFVRARLSPTSSCSWVVPRCSARRPRSTRSSSSSSPRSGGPARLLVGGTSAPHRRGRAQRAAPRPPPCDGRPGGLPGAGARGVRRDEPRWEQSADGSGRSGTARPGDPGDPSDMVAMTERP